MDKSVAASNYKVGNHIPDDLEFSILSKLPLKPLKRFGSVCKSWSLLFENPNFMTMYRIYFLSKNHASYDDTSLLLYHKIDGSSNHERNFMLYSISGDRFQNRVNLDWSIPLKNSYGFGFNILGSCSINGILCLTRIRAWDIILWNPATKESKVVPAGPLNSLCHLQAIGFNNCMFGYDRVRDDYKVIRYLVLPSAPNSPSWLPCPYYESSWEIYSLRSNSWKTLDDNVPSSRVNEYVFMDGVSHWCSKSETHNEASLVSFDFSNETFFITPIPSYILGENFDLTLVWRNLVVLNGSIALIINSTETTTFHISILGEIGVKDSWTKLFVVEFLPCIDCPIGAWKNGNMFIRKKDGGLAWFDLNTHMIEELGIIIDRCFSKIVIYKESLIPIGGISE